MAITESTKVRALREAKGLLQEFGFNGFSFQHVADLLGIKKPSLYDHFKSKEVLGQDLVEDYKMSFVKWTQTVSVFEPKAQLNALFELFFEYSKDDRKICPLSAFISEINSLPKSVRKALIKTCDLQRDWLEKVIEDGQKSKDFRKDISASALAEMVMSLGLGSQLVSRGMDDPSRIRSVRNNALKLLMPPAKV